MEGAAIFYAALFANTEFVQVRALSNYVGERDKSHWEIKGCLEAISNYLEGFINELKTSNGGAE
jgi:futalosine hydrolase